MSSVLLVRSVKWLGYLLLAASGFFVVWSMYEVYYLTAIRGGWRMVFYSLLHTGSETLVMSFLASWLAFYGYLVYAAVVSIGGMLPRFREHRRFVAFVLITGAVLLFHLIAFMTYDHWAKPV